MSIPGFCDNRLPSKYSKYYIFDPENMEFLSQRNFRFLGLISLKDPIRCSVPDAVRKCKSAGIKLIMITADHPIMAYSIAKHCGMTTTEGNENTTVEQCFIIILMIDRKIYRQE